MKNEMLSTLVMILCVIVAVADVTTGCKPEEGKVSQATATKSMEVAITEDNFEKEVLKSDKPVLVDFWAPWCGPCRKLAPTLTEIAVNYVDKIKVGKANVDENGQLATKYGISGIPTLMIFVKGKIVAKSVGYLTKSELEEFISKCEQ